MAYFQRLDSGFMIIYETQSNCTLWLQEKSLVKLVGTGNLFHSSCHLTEHFSQEVRCLLAQCFPAPISCSKLPQGQSRLLQILGGTALEQK